MMTNKP